MQLWNVDTGAAGGAEIAEDYAVYVKFSADGKRLLTGTEQGRSWAVPALHWTEGKFWLGANGTGLSDGSFNDNSYPQVMVFCTVCGYTHYFNAVIMGLVDKAGAGADEND